MNDTTDNSTRLNQFAGFLANNPDAVKNIAMIADMIKDYAQQIVVHDLRDALNDDKDMKNLICKEKEEGKTNIHQWFDRKTSLIYDITNPHFGHFGLNTFYNADSVKWEISMMGRRKGDANRYIKALKEKEPAMYENTPIRKNTLEGIMNYVKSKKFTGKYDFNIKDDTGAVNTVFINVDIIGDKKKDVKELTNILKDIITKMHVHD